jgi:hypothetical protein
VPRAVRDLAAEEQPRKGVRATTSFIVEVDGVERIVRTGEVLPADDPVVKAAPNLFEPEAPIER